MNNSILKLISEATSKSVESEIREFTKANGMVFGTEEGQTTPKKVAAQMKEAEEYVYAMFRRENLDGDRLVVPNIPISEMMASSDSSVIFKRVISEILVKPTEPSAWLTNNVAKKITLDASAPLTVTFPTVGAYQAYEVAEGGEYKPQALTFQEHIASLRLKKYGVMASLSEEVEQHSIYPLISLHLELMANGLNRRVEEFLYTALVQKAITVFDNDNSIAADRTTGVDVSQAANASLSLRDILTLAGVVVGNRYNPSHLLIHPLAYPVIFQDPLIRGTFFHQGQLGGTIHKQGPNFDQSQNMPFGLSYVPYYALPYNESGVMVNAPGSGYAAALLTDVYVIDSANSMVLMNRGDNEFDSMEDWYHDATTLKARRYFNVSAMDAGKGMAAARNIRVVDNFAPLFTVRNTV